MILGSVAFKLSILFTVIAFVSAWRWAGGRKSSEQTFRWAYHGMTAALVVASIHLMIAILSHDFRFAYVVNYTSRDLPLLYLISAFWAGQSGTFLLWALMAAGVGYGLFRKASWEPARVMTWYLPTIAFLQVLMLDPAGNPFKLVAQVPLDGHGLNPLLQDPWMASHPPLIFLGYAAMAVPAVLAIVALRTGEEKEWLRPALRWSLLSFVFLGVGIILGGFWAYKVLGWGGYWGWDPVENASLVPWLVVTALLHGVIVQRATGALPRTNLFLALAGYLLVIYATFLTRSGVLADFSVHSFPAGSLYRILVGIILLILGASIFVFVRRKGSGGASVPTELSWPFVLSSIVIGLSLCAAMVLIGTSWPIISSLGGTASAVTPAFYNRATLPLGIALLGLLAVAPLLAWAKRPWSLMQNKLILVIVGAVACTGIAWAFGGRGSGVLVLFFAAAAALVANVVRGIEQMRGSWLNTGAPIAHIGFALMFLGIVGSSSWGVGAKVDLPLGTPVDVLGRTLTFQGHVDGSEPQDRYRVAVRNDNGREAVGEVAVFRAFTGREAQMFHRPAIVRSVAGDLYIAPTALRTAEFGSGSFDLKKGEAPFAYGDARVTFLGLEMPGQSEHGMTVAAKVEIQRGEASETLLLPLTVSGNEMHPVPQSSELLGGVLFALQRLSVEEGWVRIAAQDPTAGQTSILSADVSTKPLIGLLWTGTILLLLGCLVAVGRRVREERLLAGMAGEPPTVVKARRRKKARPRPGQAAARAAR